MGNRLGSAQSAYLRQHAENPVHWWPWGAEAFTEARRRDVPVFISIGYAACHWCHVMAGESFADQATAALLNERFVAIKVDREEHPEVDDTYMAATQALTGQGGWPMSVFTTWQGQVFHAGTYFPPQRMGRVPSFTEVCEAVWEAWTQRREQVETQAAKIASALGDQRRRQGQLATTVTTEDPAEAEKTITAQQYQELARQAVTELTEQHDDVHGGFGAAPKFPPSPLLAWLLEEPQGFDLAESTMSAMARSALFDQVEGGFARYATDRAWALPHFEKMLYDNAQLIGAYAKLSAHPQADTETQHRAERAARMSIDWLRQRMLTTEGLLASSLDADTVEEDGTHTEGGTYTFSDAELTEAAHAAGLGQQQAQQLIELNEGVPADEHAAAAGQQTHLTEDTPRTIHFAAPLSQSQRSLWEQLLPELRRRRAARTQPARDDKVVAAWNAQTVQSLATASALWEDTETLQFAESLGHKLRDTHTAAVEARPGDSGTHTQVFRTSYAGVAARSPGTLADHCHTASAFFALSSAGAADNWAEWGLGVLRFTLTEFLTPTGDRLQVQDSLDSEGLLTAAQDGAADASPVDDPEPSSIAALVQALQLAEALGLSTGLPPMGSRGALTPQQLLHHLAAIVPQAPLAVGGSLLAARRAVLGSPAFRVFSATGADLAQIRRAAALRGIPVEPAVPTPDSQAELRVSICLNSPAAAVCLAPSSSVAEALAQLG